MHMLLTACLCLCCKANGMLRLVLSQSCKLPQHHSALKHQLLFPPPLAKCPAIRLVFTRVMPTPLLGAVLPPHFVPVNHSATG
jgi:hypothetical protein